jgi:prepilin-type processing-associated H-X9-DG protein
MAFQQYFQDYDEQFPFVRNDTAWVFTMQPYLKGTQMLRCPSDAATNWISDANWMNPAVTANPDGTTARRASYALNGYLVPGNSKPEQGGNFPHLASIQKPASVIFLSEKPTTFNGNYFHAHTWNPPATSHWLTAIDRPDDLAYAQHLEGFNATYLDGHAKFARWSQVWWRDDSVVTSVMKSDGSGMVDTPPMKGNFDPRQS